MRQQQQQVQPTSFMQLSSHHQHHHHHHSTFLDDHVASDDDIDVNNVGNDEIDDDLVSVTLSAFFTCVNKISIMHIC